MSRRLRLLIASIGIFLAACTSAGEPESFQDQDNRAQRQFVDACVAAQDGAEDAAAFCQCAFYTAAVELGTFQEFLDLDEQLREDPEGLSLELRALFGGEGGDLLPCQFSAADVPQ